MKKYKRIWGNDGNFLILIAVQVTWFYACIKPHVTVHQEEVKFPVHKFLKSMCTVICETVIA